MNNQLSGVDDIKITVTGHCRHSLDISDVDFCIIISNLLKNAIEENERGECGEKYIKVDIKSGSTYFMIQVRNPSRLRIEGTVEQIETKKVDKRNHGLGLRNVLETVRKNGGSFHLSGNGEEVSAKVILNIKK